MLNELGWDQLIEACSYLKCFSGEDETWRKNNRHTLIKGAKRELDVEEEQEGVEAQQFVQDFLDFVESLGEAHKETEDTVSACHQFELLKAQCCWLQKSQEESREALEEGLRALSLKL